MSNAPTVSVCIANYNGVDLIDACIRSVREQEIAVPVEIIVHDDGSADGSADFIRARHPDVRLIESLENVGYCVANNRMATAALGRYLLLLNNDATLLPGALSTLLGASETLRRPAILTLPQYDAESGDLIDNGCRLDPFLNPIPNRKLDDVEVGTVHGACLWVPKALWDELGAFPPWFGSVAEDLYVCCRARLAGYAVRALGASGYRHRVGASFGGGKVRAGRLFSTIRRRALSERNKTYVMIMTYPTPVMEMVLPIHLLTLMLEGGLLAIFAWRLDILARIYWPVLAALGRERRRLCDGRRQTMAARRVGLRRFFSATELWPHKLRMLWNFGLPRLR